MMNIWGYVIRPRMHLNFSGFELFRVSYSGLWQVLGREKSQLEPIRLLKFFELYLSLEYPKPWLAYQKAHRFCQDLGPGSIGLIYCELFFRLRHSSRVRSPFQLQQPQLQQLLLLCSNMTILRNYFSPPWNLDPLKNPIVLWTCEHTIEGFIADPQTSYFVCPIRPLNCRLCFHQF